MGLFSSIGNIFKSVLPVAASAVGTYFGGPLGGAAAGALTGKLVGGSKAVNDTSPTGVNYANPDNPGFDWSSAAQLAGGAFSAYQNYKNQQDGQETFDRYLNAQIQGGQLSNATNIAEAQKNRDFQEYLSSTAHQRETADLKKAGLNPILSGTGGPGASTPAGATAKVDNAYEGTAGDVNAARKITEIERRNLDIQEMRLQNENQLAKSQVAQNMATAYNQSSQGDLTSYQKNKLLAETDVQEQNFMHLLELVKGAKTDNEIKLIEKTLRQKMVDLNSAQYQKLLAETGLIRQTIHSGVSSADFLHEYGGYAEGAKIIGNAADALPTKIISDFINWKRRGKK